MGAVEHGDDVHSVCFFAAPREGSTTPRGLWASASGSNEFGGFVSLGEVAEMGDGVLCLTLARRYVDDKDRRRGMTPIEVGIPC